MHTTQVPPEQWKPHTVVCLVGSNAVIQAFFNK